MKSVVNNVNYLDVIESTGDTVSLSKNSVKEVHLSLGAVFMSMIDDVPYFLDYKDVENPATPGIPYTSAAQLYIDILSYLTT